MAVPKGKSPEKGQSWAQWLHPNFNGRFVTRGELFHYVNIVIDRTMEHRRQQSWWYRLGRWLRFGWIRPKGTPSQIKQAVEDLKEEGG